MIDAIERIWAEQDRSLVFRHACHHGACGSCGMRINGHERLPCSIAIRSITIDGGTLTLEPLRNLPVISDLLVNMAPFYERMERVQFTPVRVAEPILDETSGRPAVQPSPVLRYEDCLECGLCFSACPIFGTDPEYLGPGALAAIARMIEEPRDGVDRRRAAATGRQRARLLALPHRVRVFRGLPVGRRPGAVDRGAAPPERRR